MFWVDDVSLRSYGLLLDNDGGFLPENFVDYRLMDRAAVLEEVQNIGFMSDFHPMLAQISADKSEMILVIVDREQKYGDSWRVCLTADAQGPRPPLPRRRRKRLRGFLTQ